jgi:hypothetical protein
MSVPVSEVLRNAPLFADLPPEDLSRIRGIS